MADHRGKVREREREGKRPKESQTERRPTRSFTYLRILDTVLRQSWRVRDRAQREIDLRREQAERALDAGGYAWQDDPDVAFETCE